MSLPAATAVQRGRRPQDLRGAAVPFLDRERARRTRPGRAAPPGPAPAMAGLEAAVAARARWTRPAGRRCRRWRDDRATVRWPTAILTPRSLSTVTDGKAVVLGDPVHQHDWHASPDGVVQQRVAQVRGGQHVAVDVPGAHLLEHALLAGVVAVGVADQRDVAVGVQPVLEAADHRREERVVQVGDQHADGVRAARAQAAGDGVRAGSRARPRRPAPGCAVCSLTSSRVSGLSALDAVAGCTPAWRATSFSVTAGSGIGITLPPLARPARVIGFPACYRDRIELPAR